MGNKKAREFQREQAVRDQWHRARTVPRDPDDVHLPTHGPTRYQLIYAPSFDPGYAWHAVEAEPHWRLYRSQVLSDRLQAKLIGLEELATSHDPQKFFARLQTISMPFAPPLQQHGRRRRHHVRNRPLRRPPLPGPLPLVVRPAPALAAPRLPRG